MTLKQAHWPWFGSLLCATAILFGCHKSDRTPQSVSPADAKAAIYKHLAKQTGQKEFAPGIDLELPKLVATLRSNANVLEQRTTALRTSLRGVDDDEQTPLRKEIETLRAEVAKAKRETAEARTRVQEAQARVPKNADEIAAAQKERADKEAAWTAKRQELSAKEPQLQAERTARTERHATLKQQFEEAERAWEIARREAASKQEELSRQEDTYIRATRQQVAEVRDYPSLYRIIGQQLATADRLLADPDVSRKRTGVKIAREACGHVNSGAVDVWLAARICEAYFWPNLDIVDTTPDSRERALELLETSRRVFFDTYETNNVLKNYELLLANAPHPRAADTFRVQLADWLEEKGAVKHAAEILNEIQDIEVLVSADERITRVRERAAASP